MTKKMGLMALGLSMVLLSGCGSSGGGGTDGDTGDTKTVTGVFQDANVAGLNYACSSGKTDVTNSAGEYTCNVGDTVEFSLGGYVLGSVTATSGIVTPLSLFPNDLEAATDVLQLLQTLDSGEDGTITIPDNFSALDGIETRPGDADFDADMEAELGEALVYEEAAQEHMLRTLLAGQTLYTTIWDDIGTMESWAFNADLTSSTWTELVGGSATGTGSLVIDGMTMIFTCTFDSEQVCEVNPTTIEVKKILTDYVVVEVTGGELGSQVETLRLYFDEAKAREYLSIYFETMISGQTLYQVWYGMGVDSNGNDINDVAVLAKVTFNTNGSAEYVGLMNEESGSGKWEVTNDKLVLVGTSESFDYSEYNQYVSGDLASGCIQTNWVNENNANDNNIDLFFTDETTARNYANNLTSTASCP